MKRWTKDEEELLRIWVEQGWTYKDIANELDRTRKSIEKKCVRLKITNGLKPELKTHEQYVQELKEKCPTVEAIDTYIHGQTAILHKCLICGEVYKCTPNNKLQGYGHCGTSRNSGGIPINKSAILYLVYIPKYSLYKFGITSKTVDERMSDNSISKYESICELPFKTGVEAIEMEKQWKCNLSDYLVNTGNLKTGNTETFKI